MQPSVQFVHLRIPDTWPDSAEALVRIVDQNPWILPPHVLYPTLSILGSLRPEDVAEECLTDPAAVVRVALLSLPFFQQCAVDELRDRRWDPAVHIHCPAVQRLVAALARALLFYEETALHPDTLFLNLEQELANCLRRLDWAAKLHAIQYDLDRLPYRSVKPADLADAFANYNEMLQVMDRPQYMQAWEHDPNAARKHLVSKLQEIFPTHMIWPTKYAKNQNLCVDTWIAEILQAFGVEEGTTTAIITRFRARAAREPQRRAKLLERRARAQEKALQRRKRREPL